MINGVRPHSAKWRNISPHEPKLRFVLLKAVIDPTFGQIIRCHFNLHLVACQNADTVLAHFACRMCDDFMAILKLNPKRRIWQEFFDDTGEFENIFLGHVISYGFSPACCGRVVNAPLKDIFQGLMPRRSKSFGQTRDNLVTGVAVTGQPRVAIIA
jgi:hypothetical protein